MINFKLHNKAIISINDKKYEVFNQVNNNIFDCLSNLKPYNKFITLKTNNDNNSYQSYISYKTENISYQSNIEQGELFSKSETIITTSNIKSDYITELGYSDGNISNPILFNCFNLVDETNPNGLYIKGVDEISIEIYIYLIINENNFLTLGKNPFVEFLLGNGLENIYSCRGSYYSTNINIYRELPENNSLYPCNVNFSIEDNYLTLNISSNLGTGETNEVVFIASNRVFARLNTKEFKPTINSSISVNPKINYVIDLQDDIKIINSILNTNSNVQETEYYISNYANDFGDKISTPFNNMFNNNTKRFISKEGDKIFFVIDDFVYGYSNNNYCINRINTHNIKAEYIVKIISFDDYIFIISSLEPFILSYKIINNNAVIIDNNFKTLEHYNQIAKSRNIDIVLTRDNTFILGLIIEDGKGYTTYFSLQNNTLTVGLTKISNYNFSYLLAVYKNNFCDAQVIYLQEGESSLDSRIVYHYADGTESDVYSALAYNFTHNTKNIYVKNRAIIVEKNDTNSLLIYYLPQVYKYELNLLSNNVKNYTSINLNYLIQETSEHNFDIYNLIGYDVPEMFINGLPESINKTEIMDFEFLKDTLLIFTNNKNHPIVAFNLNLNKTQIENVSSNTSSYNIEIEKYDKLGLNNEGVVVNFTTKVTL